MLYFAVTAADKETGIEMRFSTCGTTAADANERLWEMGSLISDCLAAEPPLVDVEHRSRLQEIDDLVKAGVLDSDALGSAQGVVWSSFNAATESAANSSIAQMMKTCSYECSAADRHFLHQTLTGCLNRADRRREMEQYCWQWVYECPLFVSDRSLRTSEGNLPIFPVVWQLDALLESRGQMSRLLATLRLIENDGVYEFKERIIELEKQPGS